MHQLEKTLADAENFPNSKGMFVNSFLQPPTLLHLGTCDSGWCYISPKLFLSSGYKLGSSMGDSFVKGYVFPWILHKLGREVTLSIVL